MNREKSPPVANPFVGERFRDERIVAVYDYVDADGRLLFRVCRTDEKQFPIARPCTDNPTTGWVWGFGNVEPVLYNLQAVLEAVASGRTIYIVEGEKDADAINTNDPDSTGYVATTAPLGAGSWRPEYAKVLAGAERVVIWADRDEKGVEHARDVAKSLEGRAESIELVQSKEGKDAADHFAASAELSDVVPLDISDENSEGKEVNLVPTKTPLAQINETLKFVPADADAEFKAEVFGRILPLLARLGPAEQDLAAVVVKKNLGVSKKAFHDEILRFTPSSDQEDDDPEKVELSPEALSLLEDPELAARFVTDLNTLGVVGEEQNKIALLLAMTSRKHRSPLNVLVKGESSAGKNHVVDGVASCFPRAEIVRATNLSPQALSYWESDLKHKIFLICEAQGAERAEHDLRVFQSEGNLTVHYVTKVGGELRTVEKIVEGPAAMITTTTRESIHPENETRLLELSLDESLEQTHRILNYQKRIKATGADLDTQTRIRELWRNAQAGLAPMPVIVPFAECIAFPAGRVRSRRDFPKLLALIEASAFLHQHQRDHDETCGCVRIVADLRDYALAYDLMNGFILRVQAGITDREATVLRALGDDLASGPVTARQVAQHLGWYGEAGRKRAKRCLDGLTDKGCASSSDSRPGVATTYSFRETPTSKDTGISTPDQVAEKWAAQGGHLPTTWTSPLSRSKSLK